MGFPGTHMVKNLPAHAGDVGLIPGSGRSPGEENGNSLQYSCPGQFHGQKNLVGVTRQCPFASDLFPCTVVAGGFPGEKMAFVKSGWLLRQSTILKRWKKNWFDLWSDGHLIYYDAQTRQSVEDKVHMPVDCINIRMGRECRGKWVCRVQLLSPTVPHSWWE